MENQPDISPSMRTILVDWMVEVSTKFWLCSDSLYLAVNIVDRYLTKKQVKMTRLQLVGITALLIAAKYEEIYAPEVKDCVYLCERAYSRQDVLDMEVEILQQLNFMITVPTSYPFLTRFLHITHATEIMKHAANFYLERMLQEYDVITVRPSLLAAAAVCLAINHEEIREDECVEGSAPGVVSFCANTIACADSICFFCILLSLVL